MTAPTSRAQRIGALLVRSPLGAAEFVGELGLPDEVTIEDVLDGRYELTPSELVAAADVLDVPVTVLTGDLPIDRHLGVSLRLGQVQQATDVPYEALALADRLLDQQAVLDSWFGPVASPLDGVPMSTITYGKEAGPNSADRVRRLLGLGKDPIQDMVELVERLGYPVVFRDLPDGLHGLNIRDEREGRVTRVIIVSARDVWTRQRFTLAHELCHALYDDPGQVIVDRVEVPDIVPEVRAQTFARELLLPRTALAQEVRAARTRRVGGQSREWRGVVAHVMARWGVSRDAVVRALVDDRLATREELAAVEEEQVSALIADAGLADDWREASAAEHEESGSPLLLNRAVRAFGEGLVNTRFVADVLGEDPETTERLLAEQGWLAPAAS